MGLGIWGLKRPGIQIEFGNPGPVGSVGLDLVLQGFQGPGSNRVWECGAGVAWAIGWKVLNNPGFKSGLGIRGRVRLGSVGLGLVLKGFKQPGVWESGASF